MGWPVSASSRRRLMRFAVAAGVDWAGAAAGKSIAAKSSGMEWRKGILVCGGWSVGSFGVPEVGGVVVPFIAVGEDRALVPNGRLRHEGIFAGSVIAPAASRSARGVFLGGAFGAAVDVEPDVGAVGVATSFCGILRSYFEGVGAGTASRSCQTSDGDGVVAGLFGDDEGERGVGVVENAEGSGWSGGTRWVGCGGGGVGGGSGRGGGCGFAADEEKQQHEEREEDGREVMRFPLKVASSGLRA